MINLPTIKGDQWLNSNPLTYQDLVGKVILVDFWTFSCVNCLRTLPYLRDWWSKYRSKGLVIIGVHTPEFEFEKKLENVKQAVKDLEVSWPVVLDNDQKNWTNFANRYWPAKYLADKDGHIVYTHFGEGSYAETEEMIVELLEMPATDSSKPEHNHSNLCFKPTPETYCGFYRGRLAGETDFQDSRIYEYRSPQSLPEDSIALQGKFIAEAEYVEAQESGATLLLNFKATEVNLVLHPVSEEAAVVVTLDGKPVPKDIRGLDIAEDGMVVVRKPRLYSLIKANKRTSGTLAVTAKEGKFQAFAFTFSGCIS